ncbi:MAG: hypothetical protein JSV03_04280 [Planctomycetota bacterium]|nr:MAG: hypothetical protein JSV03_04280 [Planctomycetota bacterium]
MMGSSIKLFVHRLVWLGILIVAGMIPDAQAAEPTPSLRLPDNVPPVIAVWGWLEPVFGPAGYEAHIEMMARYSGVNLLATTIRAPGRLVTDLIVHDQIKRGAQYASGFGIKIAMDLDVRLAREAFHQAYPDELQEMLRLREVVLKDSGEVTLNIPSEKLSDHYTFRTRYDSLAGRLVRVYAYERSAHGIKPETVQDITALCEATSATARAVSVSIRCSQQTNGKIACVMVSFSHLTPAVFAPHLLSFQRRIIENYRDVPLAGACKDEWGFPPCYDGNPAHNDYWYSRFLAKAYSEQTGQRDFVRDCLLMTYGEIGRERERQAAVNNFNEMCRQRNGVIEQDFYNTVKSTWGPDAVVATHPTWWPYPDRREFKKNGLDWWIAERDWAQTDEIAPYCVRTSLAKKWGSPVWFNMYYSPRVADYQAEMWAGALTSGRIDYHALWPVDLSSTPNEERYRALLQGGLMRGDCRVRLLNFITRSPLDCPVAVIFGQPCAMNWAGPAYEDVGMSLCDALWQTGYPVDLIPTTEVWTGSLTVNPDGYVQYGPQRYRSVVLYHPEFDKAVTADFFRRAAKGKSVLYRMGNWTHDFDGKDFDCSASLPREMIILTDPKSAVDHITKQLRADGVMHQARADRTIGFGDRRSVAPPAKGESHLIDGTHIIVSGIEDAAGDLIRQTISVSGHPVTVVAVGLVAIRMDKQGHVEALAAGGLKSLNAGDLKIDLSERVDLALWLDNQGRFKGVLQDYSGPVPAPLAKLTNHWLRLSVPVPLE